jgi:hypothetical protein
MTNGTIPSENETGRRTALERFGYGRLEVKVSDEELEREWALLLPDFSSPAAPAARLAALPPHLRKLAAEHVRQRRAADRLMLQCDEAHARIATEGARPELVEAYAVVRDSFEQAVEDFAAHRELLAKVFSSSKPESDRVRPA